MIKAEQMAMLEAMTGETDEDILSAYLDIAGDKICRKAYPYASFVHEVPEQYEYIQVEIAVYLINKRGAEGETAHSENGISRSYENADVPYTLMRDIVPFAVGIGGKA